MFNNTKVLFIGDIVGRPGRTAVKRFLLDENNKQKYDFVIANVENASHGFGLTKKNYEELLSYGIDAMTSGNHIWDKKDVYSYIDEPDCVLIRPYNYHKTAQGVGYKIFNDKFVVINLLGRTFMPPIDCPFSAIETIMDELKAKFNSLKDKIVFVDFHAEATAEKQCFAKYAFSLGVNAVIGTHTHIQTADEQIADNCAYLTDAGSCSSTKGIIGMEYESSFKRLITSINERFEVETSYPYMFNGCVVTFDNNNAVNIERLDIKYENSLLENELNEVQV